MMGKRSDFPRIDKDLYRTIDRKAVAVLNRHIPQGTTFCEPCAGHGDLIQSLEDAGHQCLASYDLDPVGDVVGLNALDLTLDHCHGADCIITNPPWSRPILHQLLGHLPKVLPCWLLFDADWCHTKQSKMFMRYCSDIVPVGRLLWIPGTSMRGKDNVAWYRFQRDPVSVRQFHEVAA
ncbi:hypothetical protein [Pseudovibrio exalbescens]|uniref:hypothetical protein n=1 Tax=Pseudovibrio exalbescens TaxID=197461 RepID=UPI001F242053|nr:hypothetical protein [Pseudovibrio exalbescens]